MFIAMNRFKIILGKEKEFEDVWKNRDTHLQDVPGFKEFHLVKGETNDDLNFFIGPHIKKESFEVKKDFILKLLNKNENFKKQSL